MEVLARYWRPQISLTVILFAGICMFVGKETIVLGFSGMSGYNDLSSQYKIIFASNEDSQNLQRIEQWIVVPFSNSRPSSTNAHLETVSFSINSRPSPSMTIATVDGRPNGMVRPKRAKTRGSSSARPEADEDYVPPTEVEEQQIEGSRAGASSSGVGASSSRGRRQSGSDPVVLEVTYYGLEVLMEARPDILPEGVSFFERCAREDSAWSLDHSSDPE
ncbi:hypothetical protein HHK36_000913 [Tetracentron sinense]|uniref:Uncharacterized protein n=1 Tax=Tetracentron sinense TaxID=13715 RepID=A0A835A1W1_TETSI|nr:hypothetical protein HHK36_000913 [Tetracentron sinense]